MTDSIIFTLKDLITISVFVVSVITVVLKIRKIQLNDLNEIKKDFEDFVKKYQDHRAKDALEWGEIKTKVQKLEEAVNKIFQILDKLRNAKP